MLISLMPPARIICDDVISGLRSIADHSISMVVTSPPYYGLRNYNIEPKYWDDGTVSVLGEEQTVELYVQHLVQIFRAMKRVLHPRATFWLNIADCYAGGGKRVEPIKYPAAPKPSRPKQKGMSEKNLLMVPEQVALALRADGWIVRNKIVWAKGLSFCPTYSGSVMPESVRDRTNWSWEYVYHLALNNDYYYDQDACREPYAEITLAQAKNGYNGNATKNYKAANAQNPSDTKRRVIESVIKGEGRNLRNVWVIPKQNSPAVAKLSSHFATFPEKLIEPIVKLGTSEKGNCPHCYAPWQRRTIREPIPAHIQAQFEASRAATIADTGRTDGHTQRKPNYRRKVLGTEWEPTCQCAGHHEPIPSTVLDIFSGSGRAGIVATRLGRSFIGIDQNRSYCEMARLALGGSFNGANDRSSVLDDQSTDHAEARTY